MEFEISPDAQTAVREGGVACINGHLLIDKSGKYTDNVKDILETVDRVRSVDEMGNQIGVANLAGHRPTCKCGEGQLLIGIAWA